MALSPPILRLQCYGYKVAFRVIGTREAWASKHTRSMILNELSRRSSSIMSVGTLRLLDAAMSAVAAKYLSKRVQKS